MPTVTNEHHVVSCGGACGIVDEQTCRDPLRRGYACITTDAGHHGDSGDWKWAKDNLPAKLDYGYRGAHVTALAGKALTHPYPLRAVYKGAGDSTSATSFLAGGK